MSLTVAKLSLALGWFQTKANSGFSSSEQRGPLAVNIEPTVGASDASEVFFVESTLAPGGTVTFNLHAITEPAFNQVLTPTGAYIIVVYGEGANWKFEPGVANPLEWFFSGTNPAINGTDDSVFVFGAADPATVDGTNETLKITNTSGAGTLTYSVAVILKTA